MYVCVLLVHVVCLSRIGREQQDPWKSTYPSFEDRYQA